MFPGIWSLFNDNQKSLLSTRAVKFLTDSKLNNNFMAAFYEAINLCRPKIYFEPYVICLYHNTYHILCVINLYNVNKYLFQSSNGIYRENV